MPTAVEPVKLTTSTSRCSTSGAPASTPEALHDIEHAGGQPGLLRDLARTARPCAGVSSAALSTAALPQISAGNTFHATLAIGVLAAMISPATPQGWRTVIA